MLNITVTGIDTKRLRKAVEDAALKKVKVQIRGIRCAEHNETPRAVVMSGHVKIDNFCCEALRENVNRALAAPKRAAFSMRRGAQWQKEAAK